MNNLNELKLVIPDWKELVLIDIPTNTKYDFKIPEIEAKRFCARLVLIQIAEYLEVDSWYILNYKNLNIEDSGFVPEIVKWLEEKHPEILKWYWA